MSLTPISRDEMRQRKAVKDEAIRVQHVSSFVKEIYISATQYADAGCTVYRSAPFDERIIMSNMDEIIQNLRTLFPACNVEYKSVFLVTLGGEEKQYDLSTLDEKAKPFINMHSQKTANSIVIDWT